MHSENTGNTKKNDKHAITQHLLVSSFIHQLLIKYLLGARPVLGAGHIPPDKVALWSLLRASNCLAKQLIGLLYSYCVSDPILGGL